MVWTSILNSYQQFLVGLEGTLALAAVALVTSTVFGSVIGMLNAYGPRPLQPVIRIYQEIFRGSPLLVQLLIIYFGSAYLGFDGVKPFTAIIVALTLYEGAYISIIVCSGLQAVPRGQVEASRSIGLNSLQRMRYVLLPQAILIILPTLVGQWIALIKDTALASVVGYGDLTQQGQAVYARIHHPFQVLLVVAAGYFAICSPLTILARYLERRKHRT
jgi:His/Glu/Gln/Arg/opine family amino acid ABC transporter permease subunit